MDYLHPQPGDVDDGDVGQGIPEQQEQHEDDQSLHDLNQALNAQQNQRAPSQLAQSVNESFQSAQADFVLGRPSNLPMLGSGRRGDGDGFEDADGGPGEEGNV